MSWLYRCFNCGTELDSTEIGKHIIVCKTSTFTAVREIPDSIPLTEHRVREIIIEELSKINGETKPKTRASD